MTIVERSTDKEIVSPKDSQKKILEELYDNNLSKGTIDLSLYVEYDVKRGLRDSSGKGVLAGLTEISDVVSYDIVDGKKIPCDGKLFYHNYNIVDLIKGAEGRRHSFEEATYLLLFGKLPNAEQLEQFDSLISTYQSLSNNFTRDVIMKAPSSNIMNALQKSVLTLYSYDDDPEDISARNVLRQSIQIIAKMPLISVYAYCAYKHFKLHESLMIRNPKPEYSTAENILYMLRENGEFTPLEASVLDVALVIHAEHGGGNNSTFTTHVVTSSGTDTYSAMAAAIASLKGFRHGGANLKAKHMLEDIKLHVLDWNNENAIREYVSKIVDKQAFDKTGLVYGIGHAVYTRSDPRELILKDYAKKLAEEKGRTAEFKFYNRVERIAKEVIAEKRHLFKPICANVDFYSGFVYDMLRIPEELFTPIFAISRIAGWSAHRLEEIINNGKIIRPAYKYVAEHLDYIPLEERK
ncbi:MAG: citrate/2-methylcitrate synthase [Ruminiclostridium sp.]|nr:citrate/2-methylcitrate synthase [Ruminiclostridium sp.]